MPDNATLNAAIPAGASVVNAGINAFAASNLNKKTQKFSREMYDRQREDALADYTRQNDYNSPRAQMARLKEAGLNPNLVYGHGNATQPSASVRPSSAPQWNPKTPDIDLGAVGSSMFNYLSAKKSQAEIDNLQKQNTVMDSTKALTDAQTNKVGMETANIAQSTARSKFDLDLATELKSNYIEVAQSNLQKLQADTKYTLDNNERQAALTANTLAEGLERIIRSRAERGLIKYTAAELHSKILSIQQDVRLKEEDLKLKRMGMQPHDAAWQRRLSLELDRLGGVSGAVKHAVGAGKDWYNKVREWSNPFKTTPDRSGR